MKIEALSFAHLLLTTHPPSVFQPHLASLCLPLVVCIADPFYKISSEALLVAQQLVKVGWLLVCCLVVGVVFWWGGVFGCWWGVWLLVWLMVVGVVFGFWWGVLVGCLGGVFWWGGWFRCWWVVLMVVSG